MRTEALAALLPKTRLGKDTPDDDSIVGFETENLESLRERNLEMSLN